MDFLRVLLKSRKFWLVVFAVVQTIYLSEVGELEPEVWQAIDVLIGVLVGAIAAEDIAVINRNGGKQLNK